MRLLLALLSLPCGASAQTITQPYPDIPSSLTVQAIDGDQTYCAATVVSGSAPAFRLACTRRGLTVLNAITIKSPLQLTVGDLSWSFAWDEKPMLVHVQAVTNFRDTSLSAAWLKTVTGEFQKGETVQSGSKSAAVAHWTHQTGTNLMDGVAHDPYMAQLTLTSSPFMPGDQITGATSGAVATVAALSPATFTNKVKSAFDVTWAPATGGLLRFLRLKR